MKMNLLPIPGIARGAKLGYRTQGGTLFVRCVATQWKFASTETNDFHAAAKIAKDLLALHANPNDTTERSQRAREIWTHYTGGISTTQQLKHARSDVLKAEDDRDRHAWDAAVKRAQELEERAIAERDAFKLEIERLKLRNRELEGLLKKVNNKITHEQQPLTMADAVAAFLKSGHASKSNQVKTYKSILTRFAEAIGNDANIHDVHSDAVISYIETAADEGEWSGKWTSETCMAINYMLRTATRGAWNEYEVNEWKRKNVSTDPKDYFWLDDAEADVLIESLGIHGEYWSDVATLQRACGFRPEELPLIQVKNVDVKAGTIFIEHILDDNGREIRTLKTARSTDKVNVPAFAMAALKRRMKAAGDSIILFPRNDESGAGAHWPGYTDFEHKHKMWPDPDTNGGRTFSFAYRTRLQDAAEAMGLPTVERVVARTFRSTCGKELLLSGKSTEQVAAVLRDNPETVRKHYARLLAQDVSTERGSK